MAMKTNAIAAVQFVLGIFILAACSLRAPAQEHSAPHRYEGRHGIGHEKWHEHFYSKLIRNDTKTNCCNLFDCAPTQSRIRADGYEVMVEGEWTKVPAEAILDITAPDGGAHVCFPSYFEYPKGTLYCVVLPPRI
jgi:hypothetical protein